MKVIVSIATKRHIKIYSVSDCSKLQKVLRDELDKSVAIYINGKETADLSSVKNGDFVTIIPQWMYVDKKIRKKYE